MHDNILYFDKPAEKWNDAIPLGNGRLGTMAYGHACIERMQLNDDSLWYGGFIDRNNYATLEQLDTVRKYVLEGKLREAEDLISRYFVGAPNTMRHYETLGELDIALNQNAPFQMGWLPNSYGVETYRAQLDMMRGVMTVIHKQKGVTYKRETFCSFDHQVICVRLTADRPKAIKLNVQLDRAAFDDKKAEDSRRPGVMTRGDKWGGMLLDENHTQDAYTLVARGHAAETGFACAVRMESDGMAENPYTQLATSEATCVCLYIAAGTSNRSETYTQDAINRAKAAEAVGFDAILTQHIADFETKMNRCVLSLGTPSAIPLDQRLQGAREGKQDANLASLYFTFGRYLLLSSARENSAATNLQGIWCKDFIPAWDSKYTVNINEQMNYWPSEVCNLSETHQSLFWLLRRMEKHGRDTARIMYGCRGAVCHHNTDFYGDSAPQDSYMASTSWVMGGAWLSLHIWDHYLYTLDLEFLKEWYPVIRSYAVFFLDYLIDDGTGELVTCPSLSPENRYITPDGFDTPICAGPAMDSQILRAVFNACIEANKLLDLHEDDVLAMGDACARLPKNKIGSRGQLLEWREDFPELTPDMGHISHLWGVYPGSEINWRDTPQLLEAAHKSLNLRCEAGAGKDGWPLAWYICEYARMLDARRTGDTIHSMLCASATRNFLNGHIIFQIDGNFGATAGIAEALLQSHTGILHLLPALPPQWHSGSITGLVAHGGCEVDMQWTQGRLQSAELRPKHSGRIEVRADCSSLRCCGDTVATTKTQHGLAFMADAGKQYYLA